MSTTTEQQELDLLTLRCAAGTDVGMRREENQDAFGIIKHSAFHGFFVADGMGGVTGGAIASRLAIATLEELLPQVGSGVSLNSISHLVGIVNRKIFERGISEPELAGMGTTLVGLLFTPSGLLVINIGDSRAYRVRNGLIVQMTEDHTLVQELIRNGTIGAEEAEGHPVSHMLTRSLGPLPEVVVDCRRATEAPQKGDIYVICSDGLYNFVDADEILKTVEQNPLDDANQILINLANQRGGADNITVLVVAIGESLSRRRGRDYRTSRDSVIAEAAHAPQMVTGSDSALPPDDRGDPGGVMTTTTASGNFVNTDAHARNVDVIEEGQPVAPPHVEEPKDVRGERHGRKKVSTGFRYHGGGLPVASMLFTAVLVGLVIGDVARRWGVLPEIPAIFTREDGEYLESDYAQNLNELSRQLLINRPQGGRREKLPEIAQSLRQEGFDGSSAKYGAAREERSASKRRALEAQESKLEKNLHILSGPVPPNVASNVKRVAAAVESQGREISIVEDQIDAASRKLSLWFGRKRSIESGNGDLFKPGGDLDKIGATSDIVKRKIVELTEAGYRVQAKLDESELYPGNDLLRREAADLQRVRDRLLEDVKRETARAVDDILADTYRKLEELKFIRDDLATKLQSGREELRFLQVLADPDPIQREVLRKTIQGELDDIRAALKDLGSAE